MNWKELYVNQEGNRFYYQEKPLFKEFKSILKFHEPGFAPVEDETGWYHINSHGEPIYIERYKRAFGYYDGLSAVTDFAGNCFHINANGQRVYTENYAFCGNFQEEKCVVRDFSNNYFHIDKNGNQIYPEKYKYVGDFKDGFACVKLTNGHCKHIDSKGKFLNDKEFMDLGIFHKSFATAKDNNGWFHIDLQGNAVYNERYLMVEPFYNGYALVTNFKNKKLIINEKGEIILRID